MLLLGALGVGVENADMYLGPGARHLVLLSQLPGLGSANPLSGGGGRMCMLLNVVCCERANAKPSRVKHAGGLSWPGIGWAGLG